MKIPLNSGPPFFHGGGNGHEGKQARSKTEKVNFRGGILKINTGAPKAERVSRKERTAGRGKRLRGPAVPAFYDVELALAPVNAQGGPQHDEDGQVQMAYRR